MATTFPTPVSWPSEVTHRRTATVPADLAPAIGDALLAMPDVRFALAFHRLTASVTFTVECGAAGLPDVADVFRVLGGVPARV